MINVKLLSDSVLRPYLQAPSNNAHLLTTGRKSVRRLTSGLIETRGHEDHHGKRNVTGHLENTLRCPRLLGQVSPMTRALDTTMANATRRDRTEGEEAACNVGPSP